MTSNIKICKKCGFEHPVTNFNKQKHTKDGLHPYCKSCHKESSNRPISEKEQVKIALKHYYEVLGEPSELQKKLGNLRFTV